MLLGLSFLVFAGLALPALVLASGTVSLPVHKQIHLDDQLHSVKGIYKREPSSAGTVGSSLYDVLAWSSGGAYYTNVTVGTPPQTLTVILDTGSSDLYVDASSAPACLTTTSSSSCRGGSFDPTKSQTYSVAQKGTFQTQFGDGSTATGDYGLDAVGVGNVVVSNVQFGVGTQVNSTTGYAVSLLGLGYGYNEAATTHYPNIPDILKQAGAINSRLYSVYLNQLGDATGVILFGGIDTSKYSGQLHTLNILPVAINSGDGAVGVIYEFVLAITGLSVSVSGKSTILLSGGDPTGVDTTSSLPILLDTGSAAWTVPTSVYRRFAALFSDIDSNGNLPCTHQSDSIVVTIEFGGQVSIQVPIQSLVVPVYNPKTNLQYTTSTGKPLCTFMLSPDTGGQQQAAAGFLTLGDAILRSMYVVFDLDNGQISIAQAATNSDSASNIKIVQAGLSGIAQAVGTATSGGVATTATNSYTILAEPTASQSLTLSSAATAVATATGTFAIPLNGQVAASSTKTSSSSGHATSTGAASTLLVPRTQLGVVLTVCLWLFMLALGSGVLHS